MKARFILILMLAVIVMAIPVHATKYVKWDAPGPAHDGTSWCTAFQAIQAALDVAGDGEMVKVAQGTYAEKIVFKTGAILQGGFRANTPPCPPLPPDLIRDPAVYVTIIDGGANTASSRTVTSYANGSIDGFTIKGAETTVYISTSFTVSNNIIQPGAKYGVFVSNCHPAVGNNQIVGLGAGEIGVYCDAPTRYSTCLADVSFNAISGFTQYGVYCRSLRTSDGYGHYAWGNCSPIISNNSISSDQIVVCADGEGTSATISDNAIYGGTVGVRNARSAAKVLRNTIESGAAGQIGVQCDAQGYGTNCTAVVDENSIAGFSRYGLYCFATRSSDGYGHYADGNCVPSIRNNLITESGIHGIQCRRATPAITGNTISDSAEYGIYCYNDVSNDSMAALTIDGNVIERQMKGVYCKGVKVTVKNNTIRMSKEEGVLCDGGSTSTVTDNTLIGGTVGVSCYGTSSVTTSPAVRRNIIIGAATTGIVCRYSASEVWSNLIRGGSKTGIACQGGSAKIWNNTIVQNPWYGLHVEFGTPDAWNNIISGSAIGVYADGGVPTLGYNNLWNNSIDYEGVTKPASDIAADPMFLAPAVGEYHLKTGSPCIGAGDNAKASNLDLDYKDRILPTGGVVDIGCFEWEDPTVVPIWVREPGQAKQLPADYKIQLKPEVVTAAWTDSFYIQDDGRSSGILVAKAAHGLTGGQRASVTGAIATNADGEVFLQATDAEAAGSGKADPLGLPYRCLGGGPFMDSGRGQQGITSVAGMNNIGLLVKVWGRIVEIEPVTEPSLPTWFKIDEGADNSPRLIKCVAAEGDPVIDPSWLNKFAFLTGISSCEFDGPALISVIKLRKGETPLVY